MHDLKISQINNNLSKYDLVKKLPSPSNGWIRYIRKGLGMTAQQLAQRLGVSRTRIVGLELAEVNGATTLKSLSQAAEAMDCVFVYAIVPKTSLVEIIKNQAEKVAMRELKNVSHSMALEDQKVNDQKVIASQLEEMVNRLLKGNLKKLWE